MVADAFMQTLKSVTGLFLKYLSGVNKRINEFQGGLPECAGIYDMPGK
jgi:hypothetical protein